MRGSILTILFSLLIMAGFQVIAQGNGSGPVLIDLDATRTADAIDTTVRSSETLSAFEVNATVLVIQATQTMEALGITATPGSFEVQVAGTIATDPTPEPDDIAVDSKNTKGLSPLVFTFLMLLTLIVALILVAGVFRVITSKPGGNNKSQNP